MRERNGEKPVNAGPINYARPNISKEKMDSIVYLCKAISRVAEALASVHTDVVISHNIVTTDGTGPAISISNETF